MFPSRSEEKAIERPSGENRGWMSRAVCTVRRWRFFPSSSAVQMSPRYAEGDLAVMIIRVTNQLRLAGGGRALQAGQKHQPDVDGSCHGSHSRIRCIRAPGGCGPRPTNFNGCNRLRHAIKIGDIPLRDGPAQLQGRGQSALREINRPYCVKMTPIHHRGRPAQLPLTLGSRARRGSSRPQPDLES